VVSAARRQYKVVDARMVTLRRSISGIWTIQEKGPSGSTTEERQSIGSRPGSRMKGTHYWEEVSGETITLQEARRHTTAERGDRISSESSIGLRSGFADSVAQRIGGNTDMRKRSEIRRINQKKSFPRKTLVQKLTEKGGCEGGEITSSDT